MRLTFRMLTQKYMRELFLYNPNTGLLVNKIQRNSGALEGQEAGNLRPDGYRQVKINSVLYLTHRLIFLYQTGGMPKGCIDHTNHIRDDNRWCNLEDVSHTDNTRNATLRKDNQSGHSGVSKVKRTGKWLAYLQVEGKQLQLGYYTDKLDAIAARKKAEVYYGYHTNHGGDR